jgi:hypothetical protein
MIFVHQVFNENNIIAQLTIYVGDSIVSPHFSLINNKTYFCIMNDYLTLDDIKKHLNLDDWFTDDDSYLESLAEVAQVAVEKHLGYSFDDLEYDNGVVPKSVIHAMLLMIGNWYNNRESLSTLTLKEVPLAYQYLLQQFKNYTYN